MLDLSQSFLAAGVVALASFGLGRPLVRALRLDDFDALGMLVWSIALGLLTAGTGALALAEVGWLTELVVLLGTFVGVLWACVELACVAAGAATQLSSIRLRAVRGDAIFPLTAILIVLAIAALRAAAPPVASDVLNRALHVPKEVLLHGGTHALSDTGAINLAQMWSLWALALDGPVAANFLHWGLGVLLALSTVLFGRPLLGQSLGWLAGGFTLAVPAVQRELGAPLEGIPLALVATLAMAASWQSFVQFKCDGYCVAAGLMAGAAAAIHPVGILFCLALMAAGSYMVWSKNPDELQLRSAWRRMALFAGCAAAPWIVAGSTAAADVHNGSPLLSLGPLFAIAGGGMLFARRLRGMDSLVCLLLIDLVLLAFWGFRGPAWAPVVPIGSILAAWTWHEMHRLPAGIRGCVVGLLIGVLAIDLAAMWRTAAPSLGVALGGQSREAFLLERLGSYRAAAVLNLMNDQARPVLMIGDRGLYFSCPTSAAEFQSGPHGRAPGIHEIVSEGRRVGAAYVLWAEPVDASQAEVAGAPLLAARAEILPAAGEVIPILEYRFADDNNRCIRYRLWKLQGPQAEFDTRSTVEMAVGSQRVGRLPRPATR